MNSLEKKLETVANAAIIVVALSILVFGGYKYFQINSETQTLKLGSKISIPNIDWSKNKQTLILILQKGCHFCSESARFYQKLIKTNQSQNSAQIIAVLPNSVEEAKNYFKELGLEINEIKQANLASLGIQGTPTIILVNQKGEISESWVGKLDTENEEKVLQKIYCNKNEGCG